jgi:hypothetical protein
MSQPEDQIDEKETKQRDPPLPSSKPSYGRKIQQSSIQTLGKSPDKPRSDRFLENKQTQQQNQGIQSRNQIAQQLLRSHSRLISLALKPPIFYQNFQEHF